MFILSIIVIPSDAAALKTRSYARGDSQAGKPDPFQMLPSLFRHKKFGIKIDMLSNAAASRSCESHRKDAGR